MYKYFVSYHCSCSKGEGFGNYIVNRIEKIESVEDIRTIEQNIKLLMGYHKAVILNYQEMK